MIKNTIYYFICAVIFTGFISCNKKKTSEKENESKNDIAVVNTFEVFNGNNPEDRKKYQAYNLDDTCPNLLDPRLSKDDIHEVKSAWLDLNKMIGVFLAENNFDWETKEPYIKAWHRFYFHKDGTLNKYVFNFRGNEISGEKKEEYKKLMQEFGKHYKLPLQRDSAFAQCGRATFQNNKVNVGTK